MGTLRLLVSIHVDDTLVAGTADKILAFKEGIKRRFVIKELGELTKHLGLKYEWTKDEYGPKVIAMMDDLIKEIIQMTEIHLKRELKIRKTPAPAGSVL